MSTATLVTTKVETLIGRKRRVAIAKPDEVEAALRALRKAVAEHGAGHQLDLVEPAA